MAHLKITCNIQTHIIDRQDVWRAGLQQPWQPACLVLGECQGGQALLALGTVGILTAEALAPAAAPRRQAVWGPCRHLLKQLRLEDLVRVTAAAKGLKLLPVGQRITYVTAGVLE